MRSRQVQNVPPSAAAPVPPPRSARWNACECALARPGSVSPGSRTVPGGTLAAGVPGVTAVNRAPRASISTSLASGAGGAAPPYGPGAARASQANSACQRRAGAGIDSAVVTGTSFQAAPPSTPAARPYNVNVSTPEKDRAEFHTPQHRDVSGGWL